MPRKRREMMRKRIDLPGNRGAAIRFVLLLAILGILILILSIL